MSMYKVVVSNACVGTAGSTCYLVVTGQSDITEIRKDVKAWIDEVYPADSTYSLDLFSHSTEIRVCDIPTDIDYIKEL